MTTSESPKRSSQYWEARAKIIWGDKPADVVAWLVQQGLGHFEAEQIVADCMAERARSLRLQGIVDLAVGVPTLAVVAALGYALHLASEMNVIPSPKLLGFLMAVLMGAGIYGIHRTFRGAERLIFGARTEGAVSDYEGL